MGRNGRGAGTKRSQQVLASRRQKTPVLNIPQRASKGPLHLRITGIKVKGEGE